MRAALAASLLVVGLAAGVTAPASASPPAHPAGGSGLLGGLDPETATVLDFQHAMDRGRTSSVRITAFYLARIRQLNPALHAVVAVNPAVLRDAAASDARRRAHRARGPLEGIPVLLKDNVDTRGHASTAGSLALASAPPVRDAFIVRRLEQAGALVLGKANLSEWANFRSTHAVSGWSGVGGQTNNPYVLDRNPCGSSSGSGAAVAAWLAPVAVGTETDGSITCPASVNGVVGFKPTLGLVSRTGIVPLSAQQDTAGPMTRNVTDTAALLTALSGKDPADPATRDAHVTDLTRSLDRTALRGKRIGVWTDLTGGDPRVDPIFQAAVAQLRRLGATPVPVSVALPDGFGDDETYALEVEFKHDVNAYLAARPGPHPRDLAGLIAFNTAHAAQELPYFGQEIFTSSQATSGDLTDPAYRAVRDRIRTQARQAIDGALAAQHLDAIASPAYPPAWVTDYAAGDDVAWGSSTPAAVAGYPHVVVPMGYVGELPVGLSFFGGKWTEPRLTGFAYAYEQATKVRHAPEFLPTLPASG